MINSPIEYLHFLQGETTALRMLIGALIDASPDKAGVARTLQYQRKKLDQAYLEKPPHELARFRSEQILDDWAELLSKL